MAKRRKDTRWEMIHAINGEPSEAVYVMVAGSSIKIGRSLDVGGRCRGLQTGQEKDVCIYWAVRLPVQSARLIEIEVHKALKGSKYHARGEWYYMSPQAARGVVEAEIRKRGVISRPDLSFGYERDAEHAANGR